MNKSDSASVSAIALIIILTLTIGISALISSFNPAHMQMVKITQEIEEEQKKQAVIEQVMALLEEDPTPESHWAGDPIFSLTNIDGHDIDVVDISSRINPNWVIHQLIERTELKSTLINGYTPEELSAFRGDSGYHQEIDIHYRGIIDSDAMNELFTGYSLLNINTESEIVIEDIIIERTRNTALANSIRNQIRTARESGHIFSEEELATMLSGYDQLLSSILTTLPQINVNFAPARLIYEILSYPFGGEAIENHRAIAEQIISLRQYQEITESDLQNIIQIQNEAQKRVFSYLGVNSGFVQVSDSSRTEFQYRLRL